MLLMADGDERGRQIMGRIILLMVTATSNGESVYIVVDGDSDNNIAKGDGDEQLCC